MALLNEYYTVDQELLALDHCIFRRTTLLLFKTLTKIMNLSKKGYE
jgi:hypothetical protein